ncbi:class I SAM-dependent methyltransferase [Paenibacillus sp. M1]|uniref:Class I SAM-dependent methyltransferase n=1 Tax=Paenibacillus haidiansis TaxID=1574488 RepID=A0ABU7VUC8_9BACL
MPNHDHVYTNEAEKYHLLISKQPDLTPWIEEIIAIDGLDIVDLGAGTGRLTTVLAPHAESITALDVSDAMLQIAASRLQAAGFTNWTTKVADHRKLPLDDRSTDLIVSGWSVCYLASTNIPAWKENLRQAISEMKRVLRPNGTIIIFETMGTGVETPNPPDFLTAYYSSIVKYYGFSHKWIRTDYAFDNVNQAAELTRFFFGDELADRILEQKLVHLPECAGIWWLRK